MKLELTQQNFEIYSIPIFIKIHPLGAELDRWTDGQTDGETDMTKLTVFFRKYANAPKNVYRALGEQRLLGRFGRRSEYIQKYLTEIWWKGGGALHSSGLEQGQASGCKYGRQ
jgi:hypothetical protein